MSQVWPLILDILSDRDGFSLGPHTHLVTDSKVDGRCENGLAQKLLVDWYPYRQKDYKVYLKSNEIEGNGDGFYIFWKFKLRNLKKNLLDFWKILTKFSHFSFLFFIKKWS